MGPIGLYVHFPFCAGKCPYCDFYSAPADDGTMDAYADAVIRNIRARLSQDEQYDTVYFGGGTPSLMGRRLVRIAEVLQGQPIREFTVECNPSRIADGLLPALREAGVNRVSMGLQSAVDSERHALGRTADSALVRRRVEEAKAAGFANISIDLMLGVPDQTVDSLQTSLDFCRDVGVTHVSAYLLKIEEHTPFYNMRESLRLPDEDAVCELYLRTCDALESFGFMQYEISNFAKQGFESRHNLKYWNDEPYVGIGPAAHSFVGGKRFFCPRDTAAFLRGDPPAQDGDGGDFAEYAMLRLRLTAGLTGQGTRERFGFPIPQSVYRRARNVPPQYLTADESGVRLTRAGFLVSNAVIAELLADL